MIAVRRKYELFLRSFDEHCTVPCLVLAGTYQPLFIDTAVKRRKEELVFEALKALWSKQVFDLFHAVLLVDELQKYKKLKCPVNNKTKITFLIQRIIKPETVVSKLIDRASR